MPPLKAQEVAGAEGGKFLALVSAPRTPWAGSQRDLWYLPKKRSYSQSRRILKLDTTGPISRGRLESFMFIYSILRAIGESSRYDNFEKLLLTSPASWPKYKE